MVFPSVPIYLDPANWPQQSGGGSCDLSNNHHQMPPPNCGVGGETGGGTSSIKSSVLPMTDRAHTAKIPHPEAALKCPRCESTNTKFCYFNNYSLTQPRHLCKTCRRYWTRGGSLRNVPVGGGCRRNKRTGGSKGSSRSKSPAATTGADNNNNSALPPAPATSCDVMMTHFPPPQPNFMTHLSQSNQYGGLSFGGIQVRGSRNSDDNINDDVEFQMNIGGGFPEQWRVQQQQFPFMMNNCMEAAPATGNIYTYESEGGSGAGIESYNNNNSSQIGSKALDASSVKVEGNNNNNILNLSRNFLGISNGGDQNQYWVGGGGGGGNAWTELARFTNSSSSTRHLL